MSFILDALKKSESKRNLGEVPDLGQQPPTGKPSVPPRRLWPWLLVLALGLNILLLSWWLGPWGKEESEIVQPVLISKEPPGPEPVAGSAAATPADTPVSNQLPELNTRDVVAETVPGASGQRALGQFDQPADKIAVPRPAENRRERPQTPRVVNPPPSPLPETRASNKDSEPSLTRVYARDALPLALQRRIPELSVSLHYYDIDPAARMVRLNGMILREGDMLDEQLGLEQITETGTILTIDNYRFYFNDL